MHSRVTLCRYGRFEIIACSDWISSSVSFEKSVDDAGVTDNSSARRRSWITPFCARRFKVQVRLSEEVSDPANMNVLILCKISTSEIR